MLETAHGVLYSIPEMPEQMCGLSYINKSAHTVIYAYIRILFFEVYFYMDFVKGKYNILQTQVENFAF